MHKHRSFSRRSKAESEKLSERPKPREDITVRDFIKVRRQKSMLVEDEKL